jgi:sugar lactone lactonase YvrE
METVEHVLSTQNKLGEGPIWNPDEQALYWVDIHQALVQRYHPASRQVEATSLEYAITVLGLRSRGGKAAGFVFASVRGFGLWEGPGSQLTLLTHPEAGQPYKRFNDGAVDPGGRFWAGTMYEGPATETPGDGRLYRLNPDASVDLMESGLTICNGMGWSPDRRTMYFTDTLRRAIYAYDFDPSSSEIANRRVLIQADETDGYPDGMTVDEDGFLWSAFWGGWKVCRFDPQGKLERTVRLPVECPTCVAFGGQDLTDLYITSAWTALSEQQRREQPQAGDVFRLHLDIRGLEEPRFAG